MGAEAPMRPKTTLALIVFAGFNFLLSSIISVIQLQRLILNYSSWEYGHSSNSVASAKIASHSW